MRVPASPTIYEINTAPWLAQLGRRLGRPAGLGDVPGSEWDALAALPVDAVWLMGVWERSPIGRAIALAIPQLLAGYRSALPDLHEDDVLGSPYCVRDYVVDERFGGPTGLAVAREQLRRRGIALMLDYVPNHVAADHPWVTTRPECLLAGSEDDLLRDPGAFARVPGGIYAKGRDPYFAPWQDVLQLNAFSAELRQAAAETLDDDRRAMRRGAVRHGHADDQRGVRAHLGGTSRTRPRDRVLAGADWPMQGAASRFPVHGRGVLGHGMDAATAGVRPLLRQAPV